MGMFDYVRYEADCPRCGSPLSGWQTKDAGCFMDTLDANDVFNFYTKCRGCGCWVEANAELPKEKKFVLTASDY